MELRSPSAILARLAAHPVDLAATTWTARLRCATGLRHVPSLFKRPSSFRGSRSSGPLNPMELRWPTHAYRAGTPPSSLVSRLARWIWRRPPGPLGSGALPGCATSRHCPSPVSSCRSDSEDLKRT
jgi:hypothetical protein